jgi:hypothetical protein
MRRRITSLVLMGFALAFATATFPFIFIFFLVEMKNIMVV